MRVIVGTSGYSYKEWKGTFYPEDLPAAKMLSYYAEHFGTVEINNTFYRMPKEDMLAKWASEVPDGFTFVLKAPQRITHIKRLDAEDDIRYFFQTADVLGGKLGPVLFQLPPNMRKNMDRLREFLRVAPRARLVCLEFRHESWMDDEVFAALREKNVALCAADTDEGPEPDKVLVPTADWGYLRLRRAEYSDDDLAAWARRVQGQSWSDAYVFFKHEDEGKGPLFAKRFTASLR